MTATHLELSPGTALGDYRIEELLGRGASAAVYRARRADGDLVAIKVAGDLTARKLLEAEAELTAAIDHPSIVPVLETHLDAHPPYVVQELCAGGSLRQTLKAKRLPVFEVERRIVEALTGLKAAHAAGVVHRDLKPENLLLDGPEPGDGALRIADFGLGQLPSEESLLLSEGLASQGGAAGTLDYMAPEQRQGEGDHRVDLYAMGVIAFEMLTGQRPDRNDRLADFVTLPPEHLERWDRFYNGCCARVERRFPDAETAAACLLPALSPAPMPRSAPAKESAPSLSLGAWLLAAVIAAAVVLICLIVFLEGVEDGRTGRIPPDGTVIPQHQVDIGLAPRDSRIVELPYPQDIESQCEMVRHKILRKRYDPLLPDELTACGKYDVVVLLNALREVDLGSREGLDAFDWIQKQLLRRADVQYPPRYRLDDRYASGVSSREEARRLWFQRYYEEVDERLGD